MAFPAWRPRELDYDIRGFPEPDWFEFCGKKLDAKTSQCNVVIVVGTFKGTSCRTCELLKFDT